MDNRQNKNLNSGSLLSTGSIARYCETSVKQVNRWISGGKLKAFKTPGGHYRVRKDDFKEFLHQNGMPVHEEFAKSNGKKILIADDDAGFVEAISEVIKSRYKDAEIATAYDGYEALIKMGEFKPNILILDIRMPKIDGLEVCRRLRHEDSTVKTVKILAMTAHTEAYSRETVIESGADDYLIKPFKMKSLLMRINKLFE